LKWPPGTKGGFEKRKDAEAFLTRKLDDIRRGVDSQNEKVTLIQWIDKWHEQRTADDAASTRHARDNHIDMHIVPELGATRVVNIKPNEVEMFKRALQSKARAKGGGVLSSRTVNNIIDTLRTILEFAVQRDVTAKNPCNGLKRPKVVSSRQALMIDAVYEYIDAFERDTEIGAIVITLLGTGLRRGEVLALKWGDYDGERMEAMITRALQRDDGVTSEKPPKTDRSMAKIKLPKFAVNNLRRHRLAQAEAWLKDRGRPGPDDLIFERAG
jgi:integrase